MRSRAIVIVGHGSREPAANAEFEAFCAAYAAFRPSARVTFGYVELAKPSVLEAILEAAKTADEVVAIPLFLFAAGHIKNDIPMAIVAARAQFPDVKFIAGNALGVHPGLCELAFERAARLIPEDAAERQRTAVIVVGRGSSDPNANSDFFKVVRLFAEGRGFGWVLPAFMGITKPLVPDTLELVARTRPDRIVLVPYMLFEGRLAAKLRDYVQEFAQRYPWIAVSVGDFLNIADQVLRVFDSRIEQAVSGAAALPCDSCQYRTALPGRAAEVGGLRALLYSLRHTFTHSQAMPHVHAHQALKKHVLVCGNVDCADGGSIPLLRALNRLVRAAGREADIRITRTSCMGRCGEGPTLAVYPDGIWYRKVTEGDAEELFREHLVGDKILSRLVDNIMQ